MMMHEYRKEYQKIVLRWGMEDFPYEIRKNWQMELEICAKINQKNNQKIKQKIK